MIKKKLRRKRTTLSFMARHGGYWEMKVVKRMFCYTVPRRKWMETPHNDGVRTDYAMPTNQQRLEAEWYDEMD